MASEQLFEKELKDIENAYSLLALKKALILFKKRKKRVLIDIDIKERKGEGTKDIRSMIGFAEKKKDEVLQKKKKDSLNDLERFKQELVDEDISFQDYELKKNALEDLVKYISDFKEKEVSDTVLSLTKKIKEVKELYLKGDIPKGMYDEKKNIWEKKIKKMDEQIKKQICPACKEPVEIKWEECSNCGTKLYVLCRNCNEVLKSNITICPFCKIRLLNICEKCGEPFEDNWRICPACGNKLNL